MIYPQCNPACPILNTLQNLGKPSGASFFVPVLLWWTPHPVIVVEYEYRRTHPSCHCYWAGVHLTYCGSGLRGPAVRTQKNQTLFCKGYSKPVPQSSLNSLRTHSRCLHDVAEILTAIEPATPAKWLGIGA